MGGRRLGTTALVFALTELTPLGAAIPVSVARLGRQTKPWPVQGTISRYDSITTRHAVAFNYVKKPDCPPERRQNSTYCAARRYVSTSMVKILDS